jgi:hypothetical protein
MHKYLFEIRSGSSSTLVGVKIRKLGLIEARERKSLAWSAKRDHCFCHECARILDVS